MEKGESVISVALTAVLVLVVLGIQRRWTSSTFRDMASSAEDFVLKTTGLKSQIPDIPGYEKVRTYRLGHYRAALYRASPSPLVFASYRFVIYNRDAQSVFKINSVEASAQPWTQLYDFAGRHGLPKPRSRGRAIYTQDLTGDGIPDILLGQYSGGDHCCTTVTVIELDENSVKTLGRIDGLDGLPFEGLEIRRLDSQRGEELIAHRPYRTVCGVHADAADVLSVYAYQNGKFTDQTARFADFLRRVLQENLSKWKRTKDRSLHLLQTVTTDYSRVGEAATGDQFFKDNLNLFAAQLKARDVDPQACIQDMANLVNTLSSGVSHD